MGLASSDSRSKLEIHELELARPKILFPLHKN